MNNYSHNRRVGSRAGRWFCPEPCGSGFGLFVLGVIVPIPPHTQNISGIKYIREEKRCITMISQSLMLERIN